MTLRIVELTPSLAADWLAFFDGPAFADNPDWGTCWCHAPCFEHGMKDWDAACASGENRGVMSAKLAAGALTGVLAYDDGKPVGWCRFMPRTDVRFEVVRKNPVDDAASVGSIVCFVVAATHRKKGVATALLRAACDALARRGMTVAEGYPMKDEEESHGFTGPRAMYDAEGFSVFKETERGAIVRRKLVRA
jgi:GNAT superfamily N-acetyltransferase